MQTNRFDCICYSETTVVRCLTNRNSVGTCFVLFLLLILIHYIELHCRSYYTCIGILFFRVSPPQRKQITDETELQRNLENNLFSTTTQLETPIFLVTFQQFYYGRTVVWTAAVCTSYCINKNPIDNLTLSWLLKRMLF